MKNYIKWHYNTKEHEFCRNDKIQPQRPFSQRWNYKNENEEKHHYCWIERQSKFFFTLIKIALGYCLEVAYWNRIWNFSHLEIDPNWVEFSNTVYEHCKDGENNVDDRERFVHISRDIFMMEEQVKWSWICSYKLTTNNCNNEWSKNGNPSYFHYGSVVCPKQLQTWIGEHKSLAKIILNWVTRKNVEKAHLDQQHLFAGQNLQQTKPVTELLSSIK